MHVGTTLYCIKERIGKRKRDILENRKSFHIWVKEGGYEEMILLYQMVPFSTNRKALQYVIW